MEIKYGCVCNFADDVAMVKLNNKWFHIDKDGKPLYKERYESVWNFADGVAKVKLNDEYFFINKQGKYLSYEIVHDIGSRNDDLYIIDDDGNKIFRTGCFSGGLKKFEDAVEQSHKPNSKAYKEYMEIIGRYKFETKNKKGNG